MTNFVFVDNFEVSSFCERSHTDNYDAIDEQFEIVMCYMFGIVMCYMFGIVMCYMFWIVMCYSLR